MRRWVQKVAYVSSGIFGFLLLACGQQQAPIAPHSPVTPAVSELKSIFGVNQIELVGPQPRYLAARLVGALRVPLVEPQTQELIEALAICTGIPLSPTLLLTASHCAAEGLLFDKGYLAQEQDRDKLRLLAFGSVLRLRYEGEVLEDPLATWKAKPQTTTVVYRDEQRDFAVLALDRPLLGPFVDLKSLVRAEQEQKLGAKQRFPSLGLASYPNGVPLSLATGCQGYLAPGGKELFHDCDSLKGSSGGLLFNLEQGQPLALHTKGAGNNDAEFYKKNGRLEEPQDFAVQNGCAVVQDESGKEGVDPACLLERGYNRALLLTSLYPALADLLEEGSAKHQ